MAPLFATIQEQYIFVYEALLEGVECGETSIPCSNFEVEYARLCEEGPDGASLSTLEIQYGVCTCSYGLSSRSEYLT